ncbi:hypothetical protein [Xanthobacter agilis]|uniref:DoxX family protein n=1 Tax=Xanthobacter agilis TaxID=47492 RepID=A0ABU0LC96_XANAG|nr:hypothetical protein [Xanthobacter agilis]MDQ0504743.1 hypothetical protein [Xanthobacter agilis]
MYLGVIIATMLVLPLASIGLELALHGGALLPLAGKWFTFWGVGVRVMLAAVKQMTQPAFTAEILQVSDPRAHILVRELGFANASIALIALASLVVPAWGVPATLAGAVFLGLAGIQHALRKTRNGKETIAMVSDLGLAALLALTLLDRLA